MFRGKNTQSVLWGSSSLKTGLDPPSTLKEQNGWALSFGIKPNGAVRGSEIPGCQWGELGRGGFGLHSLDIVYDYEGKITTVEELEHSTPCTWKAILYLQENQENSHKQGQKTKEFEQSFKERWGLWYNSSSGGFQRPVPLGQDGISGSFPFSWTSQAEMIWCAWAKEDA